MAVEESAFGSTDAQPPFRRRPYHQGVVFLAGLALALGILLAIGDRGSYLVSVLSLIVGVVSAVGSWPGALPIGPRGLPPVVPRTMGRTAFLLVSVGVFVLGGLAAVGGYTLAQSAVALTPAQGLRVDDPRGLRPDHPVTITFDRPTPDRNYLGLRLALDDFVRSGSCTTFAHATLVPSYGGVQKPSVEVETLGTVARGSVTREPSETPIELDGSIDHLTVEVRLHANPGCRVGLVVMGATFYGVL